MRGGRTLAQDSVGLFWDIFDLYTGHGAIMALEAPVHNHAAAGACAYPRGHVVDGFAYGGPHVAGVGDGGEYQLGSAQRTSRLLDEAGHKRPFCSTVTDWTVVYPRHSRAPAGLNEA